ncbi:pseudouridine synthase [uncultured Odoribacter sp.]|uniref:pseudouridine synthase n=1 Tax=uncultured Odoribacter sp. TaxID=876416 RepID=UPI00260B6C82|nr:pseudouridine synthase [uncultured Odoribacter sp.]
MERNYNRKENGGNRKPAGRNFYKGNYGGNFSNEKRERQDGEKRERKSYERERFSSERRVSAENKETSRESAPRFRKRERIGGNDRRESREYVKKDYYNPEARREVASGQEKRTDRRERKEFRNTDTSRSPRENAYKRENRTDFYERRRSDSFDRRPRLGQREEISEDKKEELRKKHYSKKKQLIHQQKKADENALIRLNRYISMGGICSRRDADALIVAGRVKVNGEVVDAVGVKVKRTDKVEVDDTIITPEKKVYLVLNKPKDYVTTVEDPLERKTVMSLIENACKERIYPIGRLDRQTTGVLLFTNDGDLAKKLTHPKYEHKKIYHVFLDRPLEEKDLEKIASGIELEDGFIKADEINYTSPDGTQIGIEIHSGRNRIVRRIFENLNYQIVKLDRVYFAGITKKNLPRGKWRFLTLQEVKILKVYNV